MYYSFWGNANEAAKLIQREYPEHVTETVELARQLCKNSFTFRGHWEMERTHIPVVFAGEVDWQHIENNDPEWCYALNRHSFLLTLGKAWRLTGELAFAKAAATLWKNWIETEPLTEASKNSTWRPIEAGLRCENWLRALWLLEGSGAIPPPLFAAIQTSMRTHAAYLLESHGEFQQLSNWGILQDHGLLLLGLAFKNNVWRDTAIDRLTNQMQLQVLPDGTHWEQSPLYHCEVLHCCLNAILCARHAGYALPHQFEATAFLMAKALAAMLRPDGLLLCQSDSDEVDARDLIALAALLFKDSGLKACAGEKLYPENIWDIAGDLPEYISVPTGKRGGSTTLAQSGNTMLWGEGTVEAGFLHMHTGSLGSGHGHADLLHIDLVYRGESILCDSGRYTYVDNEIRHYLKSPAAHNTVCVDGLNFTQPEGSWGCSSIALPLKGESYFTPEADYVSGAHLGYIAQGVLHRRHVLRLGTSLWLWWDAFYTNPTSYHTYEHYYHFGPEGQFIPSETGGVYTGKQADASLALYGAAGNLQLDVKKACSSREYNCLEQHDKLTVTHSGTGFSSVASVVAAAATGELPEIKLTPLQVQLGREGNILASCVAQALCITHGEEEWHVAVCHQEPTSGVELVCAGELCGYGKVLVLPPESTSTISLAW